jgi:hypothetical protein
MTARTSNGEEQTTAKNRQRQWQEADSLRYGMTNNRTDNDEIQRFWLRQNDGSWSAAPE